MLDARAVSECNSNQNVKNGDAQAGDGDGRALETFGSALQRTALDDGACGLLGNQRGNRAACGK